MRLQERLPHSDASFSPRMGGNLPPMRWLPIVLLALVRPRRTPPPETPQVPQEPRAPADRRPQHHPPALRLPDTVRPVRYALDLTLLPAEPTYSGTVTIDLDVRESTRHVWLHPQDLAITQARVLSGGRTLEARTVDADEGRLGVLLPETLAAGQAHLGLSFTPHPDPPPT